MDIISRVKGLDLPVGQYCVFGSGVLEIHGIRKAKDVDILVTKELYKELKRQGWKRKWFFWRTLWCKVITNGKNEAFTNLHCGKYHPNTKELIDMSKYIDGIPFLQLSELLKFSRHLPRKKDKNTVKLIENYLLLK